MRMGWLAALAILTGAAPRPGLAGAPDARARTSSPAVVTPALDGKALFQEKCAMCHGPFGMGTGLLSRRMHPAELTKIKGLTAALVINAARIGVGNMPPITRGAASDAELRAIADWLANRSKGGR